MPAIHMAPSEHPPPRAIHMAPSEHRSYHGPVSLLLAPPCMSDRRLSLHITHTHTLLSLLSYMDNKADPAPVLLATLLHTAATNVAHSPIAITCCRHCCEAIQHIPCVLQALLRGAIMCITIQYGDIYTMCAAGATAKSSRRRRPVRPTLSAHSKSRLPYPPIR